MADNSKMNKEGRQENARRSDGKFKSGDKWTTEAGKRGAAAQSTDAKRRGGENSRRS